MTNLRNVDAATAPLCDFTTSVPVWPSDLKIADRPLGKGSNNRAYAAFLGERSCVVRAPRRRSDTQQRGNALWELRHTLKASQLKVAPELIHAFYARHRDQEWTSGLYLLMERYECDLEDALVKKFGVREKLLDEDAAFLKVVTEQVTKHIEALASEKMFLFDLKPSNVVIRFQQNSRGDVCDADCRLVDFGKDFCEWETGGDSCPPIIAATREHIRSILSEDERNGETEEALLKHVLFATMLIQLSAVTTCILFADRHDHKQGAKERAQMNPFAATARELLNSMQGRSLEVVKAVLRHDEVKGVIAHYNGRRNAGTQRTLLYACGVETFESLMQEHCECIPKLSPRSDAEA